MKRFEEHSGKGIVLFKQRSGSSLVARATGFLRVVTPLLAVVSCCGCAALGARAGDIVEDEWCTVSLAGARIGYVHTVTERRQDPEPTVVTSMFSETRIRRFGVSVSFRTDVEFIENERGELVGSRTRMEGAGLSMESEAVLTPDKVIVTSRKAGRDDTREFPLAEPVLGPRAQTRRLSESGFESGTELEFKTFVPGIQRVATSTVRFQGVESVMVNGQPMELHKAVMRQDIVPGMVVQAWMDDDGNVVRTFTDKLGGIETVRSTREEALRAISLEEVSDIADEFHIRTNARFENPKQIREAVYRIEGTSADLAVLDWRGPRQTVLEQGEGWVRLRVMAVPRSAPSAVSPGPQFLKASLYLQSDDPRIRQAAEKAVRGCRSASEKAKALERWTHENVTEKSYGVGFASAKEVLLSREGDCTEHSVLLAALLRAVGIPSRVVVGIIYWRGGFTYHMWTEAFLEDWTAFDAALAGEFVDATHIALARTALDSPSAAEPFLSLINVIGRISVEVEAWDNASQ